MESKDLFPVTADGYSKEEVERYIEKLKAEYKKVYDYAVKTKGDNDKLKKIARALSEENKKLKSN